MVVTTRVGSVGGWKSAHLDPPSINAGAPNGAPCGPGANGYERWAVKEMCFRRMFSTVDANKKWLVFLTNI